MTKRDLVVRISNQVPHLRQQDVRQVIQSTLDQISEALTRKETVELRNFGVFEIAVRKPRIGRNPNAPAKNVRIPARAVVKFKPGKVLPERVLKLTPTGAMTAFGAFL